jgi:hypothetical protein
MELSNLSNSSMFLTKHIKERCPQRNISPEVLQIVFVYGVDFPASNGCKKRIVLSATVNEIICDGYALEACEKAVKVVLILSGSGDLITCYNAYNSFRHRQSKKRKSLRAKKWLRNFRQ